MNEKDINVLLKKADELRSLFVLGQRVIPFLEEIFVFVKEIQPMFEEINVSINDNLKKMPGASEKLSKVTEANELATTEIMDILDKVFQKTSTLESNNHQLKDNYEKVAHKPIRLLEIIHKGIQQKSDLTEILPQLSQAINKLKGFQTSEMEQLDTENHEIIQSLNNDASSIMMSLQVQDITSQQLAAVDHMLQAVQEKLATILGKFKQTDIQQLAEEAEKEVEKDGANVTHFHRDIAFDPNAINAIEEQESRQADIDKMFESGEYQDDEESAEEEPVAETELDTAVEEEVSVEEDEDLNEAIDPDDIDAMFAANNGGDEAEEATPEEAIVEETAVEEVLKEEISAEEDEDLNQAIDPDDIDALFAANNGGGEEEVSTEDTVEEISAEEDEDLNQAIDPDDIDAMFAK